MFEDFDHFAESSRRHWKTNEIVSIDQHHGQVEYRHRTSRFYRAHLQQALLSHIDKAAERIHLSKTFSSVTQAPLSDELIITFTDGTQTTTDILLAADGIHSAVRRHFAPGSVPKWTGWTAFRSVFDFNLVSHIDQEVLAEANHWWGPDRTFFASRLGKNFFTIVGGNYSDPAKAAQDAIWNTSGDLEVLKEYYKDWHPAIRQMITASPYINLYPNTFASSLDTWIYGDGKITFAGDAAHAHGGAFAAGGSLALDDAWAFSLAIHHIFPAGSTQKPSRPEIEHALRLYEKTRKAHTDRVLRVVHEGNRKTVERLGKIETDEELRKRMASRADPVWIHEHDVEAAFAQALNSGKPGSGEEVQARL